jgi:hypothetical protein
VSPTGGVHLSVRGERGESWWAGGLVGCEVAGSLGWRWAGREREMADAGLLGCEAQRAKLNGPAANKRKVGEGK